jgi:hypothetical protein
MDEHEPPAFEGLRAVTERILRRERTHVRGTDAGRDVRAADRAGWYACLACGRYA